MCENSTSCYASTLTTTMSVPLTSFPTRHGAPSRFTSADLLGLFALSVNKPQLNQLHMLLPVCAKVMSFTDEFRGLDRDIEGSPKRWKKLVESECPEKEKFPLEWKGKSSLQKLIMMRALRPDRMTYALR